MSLPANYGITALVGVVAVAMLYDQQVKRSTRMPAAGGSSVQRDRASSRGSVIGLSPSRDMGQHLAVPGIKNLGNTCFLNAVLQSLGSFPIFREYLEALSPTKGLQETSFAHELLELMHKLKPRIPPTPPLTPITPTKLSEILKERVDIFGQHDQQDAQELFQMVMRLLGEEAALCLRNRDRRTGASKSGGGGLLGLVDSTPKSGAGDTISKDIPENPLLGSLMYLRHCRGCQEKSGRIERFVDLSLTLPQARNHHVLAHDSPSVNLEEILEDFTQQQLVEDVECPKCAMRSAMEANDAHGQEEGDDGEEEEVVVPPKRVRADMRMLLATPPKTLCLHFPRRHQSPSGSEMKLKQKVDFPVHLNVAPFCYTGGCHTESIGVSTTFQMKRTLAGSLPQLATARMAKPPARAGVLSETFLQTPPPTRSPALKALQSPPPHPGTKKALVGGSVEGASASTGGRKELNGLPNGGSRAGGSSVSESVEGRDPIDGGSVEGQDGGMDYDLRAVIVHRGGADSGHYTAFRKLESNHEEAPAGLRRKSPLKEGEGRNREDGAGKEEWVYISDEDVETVSEKKVLNSEAYMLFYRQRISDVFNQGLS